LDSKQWKNTHLLKQAEEKVVIYAERQTNMYMLTQTHAYKYILPMHRHKHIYSLMVTEYIYT